MKHQLIIECSKGTAISQLKLPNDMLEKIVELLRQNHFYVKYDSQNQEDLKKAKNFLRRVTPFMMTGFMRYLGTQENYKQVEEGLKKLKLQKASKQHKYELNDLRNLLQKDSSTKWLFLQAFEQFLSSSFIRDYIQNNQKVQSKTHKRLYLKTISLFQEEITKKERAFVKFISDSNAEKIASYWNEIDDGLSEQNSQASQVQQQNQPKQLPNVEAQKTQEYSESESDNQMEFDHDQFYQFDSSMQFPQFQRFQVHMQEDNDD